MKETIPFKLAIPATYLVFDFISGVLAQHYQPGHPFGSIDLTATGIQAILIFLWFRADANERNFTRNRMLNIAVLGIAALAIPYYFFRSRGFRNGSVATLLMAIFFVASEIIHYGGAWAAYWLWKK